MSYIDDHRASGFQVGDIVRVFASCHSHAGGWQNSWASEMTAMIGQQSFISSDEGQHGFTLGNGYLSYPWFVLELVSRE